MELRDGAKDRYLGKGVQKAVKNVSDIIGPEILGYEVVREAGKARLRQTRRTGRLKVGL